MRILIVEDDPYCQQLMHALLSRFGKCDIASNGHDGINRWRDAIAEGDPFRVICIDIDMPLCNGYPVIRAIRESHADPRSQPHECHLFVTTSRSVTEDMYEAHRAGEKDAYVATPILPENLCRELAHYGFIPLSSFTPRPRIEKAAVDS